MSLKLGRVSQVVLGNFLTNNLNRVISAIKTKIKSINLKMQDAYYHDYPILEIN